MMNGNAKKTPTRWLQEESAENGFALGEVTMYIQEKRSILCTCLRVAS